MSLWAALGITLGVLAAYMTLGWLMSLAARDASIVDPLWGAGFAIAAASYFALLDGYQGRKIVVLVLVYAWAVRLSTHLIWRNWGRGEDPRYGAMRAKRPKSFWWYSYFQVFLLQAVLLWLVAAPIAGAMDSKWPAHFTPLDYVGMAVWLFGFAWEVVGDAQLALFRRDPANKGKVMQKGAWRYTRHPNYFGDAVQWWGVWLVAAAAEAYWSVYGPVVITFLLLRVSGVTLLERGLTETRPGYREYIERTSPFVPWFPRRVAEKNSDDTPASKPEEKPGQGPGP
jgi:steroid 5-alpha reductase family enzyme